MLNVRVIVIFQFHSTTGIPTLTTWVLQNQVPADPTVVLVGLLRNPSLRNVTKLEA